MGVFTVSMDLAYYLIVDGPLFIYECVFDRQALRQFVQIILHIPYKE